MVEIKLPENPNLYFIIFGIIFFITSALSYPKYGWDFAVIFLFVMFK